jgi:DNA-binding transcriptional ArsR family regulator
VASPKRWRSGLDVTSESHIVGGVDEVFRALGDPSRRVLLDALFDEDGQTLTELCEALPAMTRFGVMKHLDVLEAAGLLTTQRHGREKLHYLNPVPIRILHDRWISKFSDPLIGALVTLKHAAERVATPTSL